MKKPQTVIDDKGNVYIVPGQMTREEATVYFPNQPERLNPEDRCKRCNCVKEVPCRNCLLDKALD